MANKGGRSRARESGVECRDPEGRRVSEGLVQPDLLELDTVRYELRRGARVLRLEKIPMELLILLAQRKDQLVGRQEIIEKALGKGRLPRHGTGHQYCDPQDSPGAARRPGKPRVPADSCWQRLPVSRSDRTGRKRA